MVVLFGAGQIAEKEIKSGASISYIVDNNPELHGTTFCGFEVLSPGSLKDSKYDVMICTSSIKEVIEQLDTLSVSSEQILLSNHLGEMKRAYEMEKFQFKGYISSGLPSREKELSGGGVFYIEQNGNDLDIRKILEANTHGMIKQGDYLFISAQGHGIIKYSIKSDEVVATIPLPDGHRPHGLRVVDENLFVACSMADSVLQLDMNGDVIREYSLSAKRGHVGTAQHHCNDLYVTDHSIYLSMFSFTGNWKKGSFDGGVIEINRQSGSFTPVIQDLKMPHSITMHDDILYVLDSYRGAIRGYDNQIVGYLNGFVRGIDFYDSMIIVGESKNRNISKLNRGKLFASLDSRITCIDPVFRMSKSIQLPAEISEIHSVVYSE